MREAQEQQLSRPVGPLADIRVLDLTVARAGPNCVRQLADWGADVLRIEPPPTTRSIGAADTPRHGSDFQNLHRNKRSVTVDLKDDAGHATFLQLVSDSDILIESMRPAVKHRLSIGYEHLREVNPRLIYGSISGFGQEGPYADRGGVDQIAQGLGGLMSITGQPGEGPVRVGIPLSDLAAGLYLAIGVLVALHERGRTGEGQWVHTSLLEAQIAMLDFQATRFTIDGTVACQAGNHHPTNIPMGCFRASDGYVNIAAPAGRLLEGFCKVTALEHVLTDPRFESQAKRSENRDALNAMIAERISERTVSEWVEVLNEAGVPAGPVNDISQVFADPQVQYLEMTRAVDHPALGALDLIRNAVNLSGHPSLSYRPAPENGEHTENVLRQYD